MAEVVYHGYRANGAVLVEPDIPPRFDLCNHSPTGFEWGYGGSGPAQLALALLAHATQNDELALNLYQRFKWDVVAYLPWPEWTLTRDDILRWVEEHAGALNLPSRRTSC